MPRDGFSILIFKRHIHASALKRTPPHLLFPHSELAFIGRLHNPNKGELMEAKPLLQRKRGVSVQQKEDDAVLLRVCEH